MRTRASSKFSRKGFAAGFRLPSAWLFVLLLAVFTGIPALYFSYVPVWDGWQFSRCYLTAAVTGSLWCFDHSAFVHTYLFGLTQKYDPGNFHYIYALNILLGVLGLICMRGLLGRLCKASLSPTNMTLLSFVFGLAPVFLVQIVQPSLDYTLPIYLTMTLYFLYSGRFFPAALAGVLMVFTKESGFMLYGVGVFLYVPLMLIKGSLAWRDKKRFLSVIGVLSVPIVSFVIYMFVTPKTQIGDSWFDGMLKMLEFYAADPVMAAQLVSLLVLNFNWILTVIVAAGLIVLGVNRLKGRGRIEAGLGFYDRLYFYLLLILYVYFLTRIPMWNNPRYMLPVLPVLVILLADSLPIVFKRQTVITGVLAAVLVLLGISSFRTIDPVSKKIMGTFKFGSHEMLNMASFENAPGHYGRDQLVYNFEFTEVHYLTEKIYETIGTDKLFVTAPHATWSGALGSIDKETGRRMMYGEGLVNARWTFSDALIKRRRFPEEIYFIAFPHMEKRNEEQQAELSYVYDGKDVITVEDDGYAVEVYHYVRKDELR
ncbi:MAG: hypothetical protein IT344_02805 [Candidatus Dadabacteria bacterium]|nr:hypothetical protein [Candidatus Dadabacteria bacterium]